MKTEDLIKQLRTTMPADIAREICSVQPMDSNIIKELLDISRSEKNLIDDSYEPVSNMKLLWIKEEEFYEDS